MTWLKNSWLPQFFEFWPEILHAYFWMHMQSNNDEKKYRFFDPFTGEAPLNINTIYKIIIAGSSTIGKRNFQIVFKNLEPRFESKHRDSRNRWRVRGVIRDTSRSHESGWRMDYNRAILWLLRSNGFVCRRNPTVYSSKTGKVHENFLREIKMKNRYDISCSPDENYWYRELGWLGVWQKRIGQSF